jgi:virginiamycin B lyase
MRVLALLFVAGIAVAQAGSAWGGYTLQSFPLPQGSAPHDVWPAPDGTVWYTAQAAGALGRLDPRTGKVDLIPLGEGSAPHGVIVGPDGAAWVTDGGLNAIVRVDPATKALSKFPLPEGHRYANLNTATFDKNGILWFTGQSGIYGVLDPRTESLRVFDAPKGSGPYGITTTPAGAVFYASLAGSYLGRIDLATGAAQVIELPTPNQGARRVWSDSRDGVWVSEWNGGQIARYDSKGGTWQGWRIPGENAMPYGIYVDEQDKVWVSDWGANAIWRFDPVRRQFEKFALPRANADIRQMAGRKGELWAAESGTGHLLVIRFE